MSNISPSPVRDEYEDDDAFHSPPHLPFLNDVVPTSLPPPALWDNHTTQPPSQTNPIHPSDFAVADKLAAFIDDVPEGDSFDEEGDDDDDDDDDDEEEEDPARALNYFVHNGYRYDGDIFQLRPPQERSIASRPERILEHKPLLLTNQQTFNRVYSEGTYNARPSSLRQPQRSSSRFSISSLASNDDSIHQNLHLIDTPENQMQPLPVTRPPSLRPTAATPLSPRGLCRSIEEVRQAATSGHCNENLFGLLAFSSTPVTRIQGEKPDLLASKSMNVSTSRESGHRQRQNSFWKTESSLAQYTNGGKRQDENSLPQLAVREKRGRSYTSFVKNYAGTGVQLGERVRRSGEMLKRAPFWRSKLLSR